MRFEGEIRLDVPRQKAWDYLRDPYAISQCAPGLKSVDIIVPDKQFKVLAGVSFGSVQVTFDTDVELLEMDEPSHSKVKAHGKAPGSALDILGDMYLVEIDPGATTLQWNADVSVVGTIASLASRLMGPVTKKLSDAFFDCLKKKIEA
jgi:carbon monoxide dehydrogenase subunit G